MPAGAPGGGARAAGAAAITAAAWSLQSLQSGAERPRRAPRVTVARDGPPRRPQGAGHARGAGFRLRWGFTYSVPAFWGDVVRWSPGCGHEAEGMAWRSCAGCWAGPGGSSGSQRGGCQLPVNSLLCGWPRTTLGRAAEAARWRTCGPPVPHGAPCMAAPLAQTVGARPTCGPHWSRAARGGRASASAIQAEAPNRKRV